MHQSVPVGGCQTIAAMEGIVVALVQQSMVVQGFSMEAPVGPIWTWSPPDGANQFGSAITAANGIAYFYAGSSSTVYLCALDMAAGTEVLLLDLTDIHAPIQVTLGTLLPPVVFENTIVVGGESTVQPTGVVIAVTASTGEYLWNHAGQTLPIGLCNMGPVLFVADGSGEVWRYDMVEGTFNWVVPLAESALFPPLFDPWNRRLVVASAGGTAYGLSPDDGDLVWVSEQLWATGTLGAQFVSSGRYYSLHGDTMASISTVMGTGKTSSQVHGGMAVDTAPPSTFSDPFLAYIAAGHLYVYSAAADRSWEVHEGDGEMTMAPVIAPDERVAGTVYFTVDPSLSGEGTLWAAPVATVIGPAMEALAGVEHVLYGLAGGTVFQYQNTPYVWNAIGDDWQQIAGGDLLWALNEDGELYRYDRGQKWTLEGDGYVSISAAGPYVLAVDSSGDTHLRDDAGTWTSLGSGFSQVATNGKLIFGITSDGTEVQHYNPGDGSWTTIGDAASWIYVAPNALYAMMAGSLQRWSAVGDRWTVVGSGSWTPQCATSGVILFSISGDGDVGMFSGLPNRWVTVGQGATVIGATGHGVFTADTESTSQLDLDNEVLDGIADPLIGGSDEDFRSVETAAASSTGPSAPTWYWTFLTANVTGASFTGQVFLYVEQGGSFLPGFELPATEFTSGTAQTFGISMPDEPPGQILITTKDSSYFGDDWTVATVWGLAPGGTTYIYQINGKIGQRRYVPLSQEIAGSGAGTPSPVVLIWGYVGLKESWGHAALMFSDKKTYVSWWPNHVNRWQLPLLPYFFCSDVYNGRTYADDLMAEGVSPGYVLPVSGLDEAKMQDWWTEYVKTTKRWCLVGPNCSSTVANALLAGGGLGRLTGSQEATIDNVITWTPQDVLTFVTWINGG